MKDVLAWLMSLLTALLAAVNVQAPTTDYVGLVAAEAAYATLLSNNPVKPKPLVDPKDCKTCNGTGRIRTGDGQGWTKCPDCQPVEAAVFSDPAPLVFPAVVEEKKSEEKEVTIQSSPTHLLVPVPDNPNKVYIIRRK